MMARILAVSLATVLSGCAFYNPVADWQRDSRPALDAAAGDHATAPAQQPRLLTARDYLNQDRTKRQAEPMQQPLQSAPTKAQEEKTQRCIFLGAMYSDAATMRDMCVSPQDAITKLTFATYNAPADQKKKIINAVYFDPSYRGFSPSDLRYGALHACLNPGSVFRPLK